MKELNDKSTVLAGVKEKTKMYVDRLNVDHAATLAALQTQVGFPSASIIFRARDFFRERGRACVGGGRSGAGAL